MQFLALIAFIFRIVQCTSYWLSNFDGSRKTADMILREYFNSATEALNALETIVRGKLIDNDDSIVECSYKLIQLMQLEEYPFERALKLLDMLLPLVSDEEGQQMQSYRLMGALHTVRTAMPSGAFETLLQRPVLAKALKPTPRWWIYSGGSLSVPVFMAMLRIGCRLEKQDIIDPLCNDVSSYWQRDFIYDLTMCAQTACSILYIPEKVDWTMIVSQVPESKVKLRSELIDVLAVRKAAEKFIAAYIELLIGTKGLVLPNDLMLVIRTLIIMFIRQEFDKVVTKYSSIFVLTLW